MESNDNEPISMVPSSAQTEETQEGAFVNYGAVADDTDVEIWTTTTTIATTTAPNREVDTKINPVFDNNKLSLAETGGDDPSDGKRDTWGKKADFLLSAIGFAVDLANVWRFPYLCYRNGGGAFLIPYVIFLIFGGIPLLYMEMALGQYGKTGAISVWNMCPLFKGVGWAVVLIAWYVATYYNVIIAWAVYYLVSSFTRSLPWTGCGHAWNTPYCYDSQVNETWLQVNGELVPINSTVGSTSAEEFFNRGVLGVHNSSGIDDIGGIKWQLLLCLVGVLLVVYFSIWKGVKTSGKVVWVTATLPYLVITILLVRGVTLPGSAAGIRYYLTPDFERLRNAEVWIDAAVQIFYSIGAGFGVHIAYSSYNKFNNNIYRDALFTSSVNCVTSFFSGFAIFAVLGYMSDKLQRPIEEVATDGPGLVFIVYPEALATLPGAAVWSVLFYLMLITLGLDSSFGGMEAVITGLTDEFPTVFKKRRELLVAGVVGSVFLFALLNVTYGGLYIFTLQDKHFAGTSLLFAVTVEVIAVSWFYGLINFSQDIKRMIGSTPGIWWRICWKFAAPLFLVFILLVSVILSGPLTLDDYIYPHWANVIGWCLTGSSMILVPLFAVYELTKADGKTLREKFLFSITPVNERYLLNQGDGKRLKANHWLSV